VDKSNASVAIVKVNKKYFRPHDITYLRGNYSKLKEATGWVPKTSLDEIV
jgi:GDP-D-mannose dehydratase